MVGVAYRVLLSQGTSKLWPFGVSGRAIVLGETKFGWGFYHPGRTSYAVLAGCTCSA